MVTNTIGCPTAMLGPIGVRAYRSVPVHWSTGSIGRGSSSFVDKSPASPEPGSRVTRQNPDRTGERPRVAASAGLFVHVEHGAPYREP